jgi:AraC-like DNA-binding protein
LSEPSSGERFRLGAYREAEPPRALRPFVAALWWYARPHGAQPIAGDGHRLLPDTELSIAAITRTDPDGVADLRLVVRGPITRTAFFAPPAGYRIDGVRMRPEWCTELLGIDPDEHLDAIDLMCDVRPPLEARFQRAMSRGQSPLAALVDVLRDSVTSTSPSRNAVITSGVLSRLRRGHSTFSAIARDRGMSERQLRRIIKGTARFGAKYIQRISRFQRAVLAADRMRRPDWATIALDAGFYDQAHMIEQFSSLAGCTPAQLFHERRLQ